MSNITQEFIELQRKNQELQEENTSLQDELLRMIFDNSQHREELCEKLDIAKRRVQELEGFREKVRQMMGHILKLETEHSDHLNQC